MNNDVNESETNMRGKLIVIEGLDGSGKQTQSEKLYTYLKDGERLVKYVSFPDYSSQSSALVKMYLSGKFGDKPGDVGPYASSLFYTVDRIASFKTSWGEYYENGAVIVANRYTTSNAVHQTCKLPEGQWDAYLDWLYDLEFNKVGLPKPDAVIYLDMPSSVSSRLISKRYSGDEDKRDIHEKDRRYLEISRVSALYAAERLGWHVINCAAEREPLPVEEIHKRIVEYVEKIIS